MRIAWFVVSNDCAALPGFCSVLGQSRKQLDDAFLMSVKDLGNQGYRDKEG
jgi:hypothetical protein